MSSNNDTPQRIPENVLSRDDLFLMMKSYENSIRLNNTLLEQQKKLIDQHTDIIGNQIKANDMLTEHLTSISKNTENCATFLVGMKEDILEKITEHKEEDIKQFGQVRNKIYIAMGGSVLIILSLITLTISAFNKYGLIEEVQEILEQILLLVS